MLLYILPLVGELFLSLVIETILKNFTDYYIIVQEVKSITKLQKKF